MKTLQASQVNLSQVDLLQVWHEMKESFRLEKKVVNGSL